ncbi:MAG: hypothetical protein EBR82_52895 [Caulobacteraceae bacterium]|nr:hypothetical protein [Caulobacteraceae bacterium]
MCRQVVVVGNSLVEVHLQAVQMLALAVVQVCNRPLVQVMVAVAVVKQTAQMTVLPVSQDLS